MTAFPAQEELERSASTIAFRTLAAVRPAGVTFVTLGGQKSGLVESRLAVLRSVAAESECVFDVSVAETSPESATADMQRVAVDWRSPGAIVCGNGLLTPYVLEGLRSSGLAMPRDVSFLCYGDSAWHRAYSPSLSVIRHDYALAAQRSVGRLVARIEGRDEPEAPLHHSEFILRESILRPA